jgi:AcrR family transcriptional regulator
MAGRSRITREAILAAAKGIVAEQGAAALTFQALASALGVSKQAIIYWFANKWELALELSVAGLKSEAEATTSAIAQARTGPEAIERFVRALVGHHLEDLAGFRMLYLAPQFERRANLPEGAEAFLRPIHETTSAMYAALEARISADPGFRPAESPRQLAVAVHAAGIGLLTMIALGDSVNDPLAHSPSALIDSLVGLLTGPTSAAQ